MSKAKANNIRIEYETFGDPSSPPILLIIGLGSQLPHGELWAQVARDIIAHTKKAGAVALETK
jgi:hypothetical protein